MPTDVVLKQVAVLAVMTAVGVMATRAGVITPAVKDAIARLVVRVALPLLIFTNLAGSSLDATMLASGAWALALAYGALLIALLVSRLSARVLGLGPEDHAIHVAHTLFGNVAFLGFPLLDALFPGGEGLLYATIFQLASDSLLWTIGVQMLRGAPEGARTRELAKKLVNPNSIALALGIIALLLDLRLPEVLALPLTAIGRTTVPLAMLHIGATLATAQLVRALRQTHVIALAVNKLALVPALVAGLMFVVEVALGIAIDPEVKVCILLQSGMPCMALVVVLVKESGVGHATDNIVLTTALSLATLPALIVLLS